jgi:hypothetical protein
MIGCQPGGQLDIQMNQIVTTRPIQQIIASSFFVLGTDTAS